MMKELSLFITCCLFVCTATAQIVYIPDPVFKTYLIGNSDINTNGDSEIQLNEAETYTGEMILDYLPVEDFTGIEAFSHIDSLYIIQSLAESIDLSQNGALTFMLFFGNQELFSLNVENGNNHNVTEFHVLSAHPNLSCIQVDDAAYSTNNWNVSATGINFSEDCSTEWCVVDIPDEEFKNYLLGNSAINTNGDLHIQCSEASSFDETMIITNIPIGDMTGIEEFTALTGLILINSPLLTTINLNQNSELTFLGMINTSVASLDLSQNTLLETVGIDNSALSNLDLSQNTNLISLQCNDNSQLTGLNVANGNNSDINSFQVLNNALSCIIVDDAAYSTVHWTDIDPTIIFTDVVTDIVNITDTVTSCDSFTWVNGITYSESSTASYQVSCDTIRHLNLNIKYLSHTVIDTAVCDSLELLGTVYYTDTIFTDTLFGQAANACDSLVTYNLTVNSTASVDEQVACNSHTWIDGNTYTTSTNTPTLTYTNVAGCDSTITLHLTVNHSTYGVDTQTACDTYTWIDGNTYTADIDTPTYTIVGGAANGCDSIVTLDLIINPSSNSTDTHIVCEGSEFTWIDGNTYTSDNNTATQLLSNAANCDSLVALDLTFTETIEYTDVQTACDTYTWIDGNTYAASTNTPSVLFPNGASGGCDSIVTLNLTIENSNTAIDTQIACGPYIWIDGNTYTTSNNIATHTVPNAAGCDSIIQLNLMIHAPSTGTDEITACNSYTWIDGNTYTNSNTTATHTLTNSVGCDSLVMLDLTINTVDTSITQDGATLIATTSAAAYEWIDCENNMPTGETSQTFTPVQNGDYAVILTSVEGCVDTSSCYTITTVGIENQLSLNDQITVYPNPTNGKLYIETDLDIKELIVFDLQGKKLLTSNTKEIDISNLTTGVYLIDLILFTNEQWRTKVMKE